jgi:hypothetical protein
MSRRFHRAGAAMLMVFAINACSDQDAPSAPVPRPSPPLPSLTTDATTYGGQAYALQVRIPQLGISQRVADTGPLPSGGGKRSNALIAFAIPNILQLEVLSASTSGQSGVAQAQAKVNRTKLFVGPNVIIIEVVQAFAKAQCVGGNPVVNGSTVIVSVTINNQKVAVTGQPNQTVPLPGGGTLTINEQNVTTNAITVRGVHVRKAGVLDIDTVVSYAHSEIHC